MRKHVIIIKEKINILVQKYLPISEKLYDQLLDQYVLDLANLHALQEAEPYSGILIQDLQKNINNEYEYLLKHSTTFDRINRLQANCPPGLYQKKNAEQKYSNFFDANKGKLLRINSIQKIESLCAQAPVASQELYFLLKILNKLLLRQAKAAKTLERICELLSTAPYPGVVYDQLILMLDKKLDSNTYEAERLLMLAADCNIQIVKRKLLEKIDKDMMTNATRASISIEEVLKLYDFSTNERFMIIQQEVFPNRDNRKLIALLYHLIDEWFLPIVWTLDNYHQLNLIKELVPCDCKTSKAVTEELEKISRNS